MVGIILLALVGPTSPVGVHAIATTWAILMALLFVTLPFVVRSVQPVVQELDREMEEAAASLGASSIDDLPPRRAAQPRAGHPLGRGA